MLPNHKRGVYKNNYETSKYDHAVFCYNDKNELQCVLAVHGYNIYWGDNQTFIEKIIKQKILNFGVQNPLKHFCLLGFDLYQEKSKQIYLNQIQFLEEEKQVILSKQRLMSKSENLNTKE